MTNASLRTDTSPVLRTLSPALRNLERSIRGWLDGTHRSPLSTMTRAALEGLTADLKRQADALEVERPLLVVMLMGGTGVGKSTLLNALAGGTIAHASVQRPTTRDPVVYYHESIRPDRLDPALRHCRLVPHDRKELDQKILVDTPDVDSCEVANRDKLMRLLPIADIVLYVGSQEKYHDQIAWDLFLQQRKRRAFAFVLNKWDRCLHTSSTGMRPDLDLLRDLEAQGFKSPLLFRTCSQLWVDGAAKADAVKVPDGEQFRELVEWLGHGLSRLEVEAIKARGVSQLLAGVDQSLQEAAPPQLGEVAPKVRAAWVKPLAEEATAVGDVLVNTLEPFQREIEHHFALEGHRHFHGLMGWYLQLVTRTRFVGSSLTHRIPFVSRSKQPDAPAAWDLARFTSACSDVAGNRMLDARGRALGNRLLVDADHEGFPLSVLTEPVEAAGKIDWRQRWARLLSEVLESVEKEWTRPTGTRGWMESVLVPVANWLPPVALLAGFSILLWRVLVQQTWNGWLDVFMPAIVLVVVLLTLHLLIYLLLPLRWDKIRDTFHRQLEKRVREELEAAYLDMPGDLAEQLNEDRKKVEKLQGEAREVAAWLARREQASGIVGLYGS